jgi:hypothetical protein
MKTGATILEKRITDNHEKGIELIKSMTHIPKGTIYKKK